VGQKDAALSKDGSLRFLQRREQEAVVKYKKEYPVTI
jgi:hypothetical protein